MRKILQKITNKQIFIVGLIGVLASFIPYLILGVDSIVPYHDQLDGELINYIYQAKYLFSGTDVIPEFLSGASKTSMTPPAPFAVLLFKFFEPFTAYMILQFICQLTAYTGMYALARVFTDKGVIALVTAYLFTYIPFVPVYGLSIYGTPMLVLCILYLYRGEHRKWSYAYMACYAMLSSLVLCGFAWLGFGLVGILCLTVCGQLKEHKDYLYVFFLMLMIYIAENLSLLGQMLGLIPGSVSHKSEIVLNSEPFASGFVRYLKYNGEHASDNHLWILWLTALVLVLLYSFGKKLGNRDKRKAASLILLLICVICFLAALWGCGPVVAFREQFGVLKAFNFGRVFWMTPVLWYMELAICLDVLWSLRGSLKYAGFALTLPLLCMAAFTTLKNSMVKPCVQEILLPNYETISYSDYYAIGVMEQVEAYIEQKDGLKKDAYKVASLGIDPAAALYHGFYCIDGYSNNYDLEYKHKFREIIAPELERNDWLKSYYDDWGNRCYLFFSEIPGYFNVEKNSAWVNNLQLNTGALKEMDCAYIFSALYIVNAEELGLEWMDEITFETENSYYQIFIYKVK